MLGSTPRIGHTIWIATFVRMDEIVSRIAVRVKVIRHIVQIKPVDKVALRLMVIEFEANSTEQIEPTLSPQLRQTELATNPPR